MPNLTLNLAYDENFLEFVDSSSGPFITSDGMQGAVSVSPSGAGRVLIGARRSPGDGGVSGPGNLAALLEGLELGLANRRAAGAHPRLEPDRFHLGSKSSLQDRVA